MLESLLLAYCLAVPGPVVEPMAPTAPVTAVRADMQVDKVSFKASDGTELEASFFVPKGDDRAPAALLIHRAGGDRTELVNTASYLWKSGYAVLTIDLRGHGESIDKPENAYSALEDDDARARAWAFATRDVEAAARWLRGNKRVHTSNLTMVGVAEGSALAVRQAVNDENVRAVALLAPKREMLGFDLVEDLLELEGLPTYLFSSKSSRDETQELADEIHDELGCKQFITVEGTRAKTDGDILGEKKFPSALCKPLKSIAFPKRDGGRRD